MSGSVVSKRQNFKGLVPLTVGSLLLLGLLATVATLKMHNMRAQHAAELSSLVQEEPGYIDKKLQESGKGWLLSQDTISHSFVQCIYQKDVAKAQRDVDENNSSFNAKVYGETKLTPCILPDGAVAADIKNEAVKNLGLTQDYVVGEIRTLNEGGFTEDSYFVKTVHVMSKKAS
ncbi:MAG: hypothetical protein RSG77_19890 [Hafnia sp.]